MPVVDLAREAARRYVDGLPLSARVKALLRSVSGSIRSLLVEGVVHRGAGFAPVPDEEPQDQSDEVELVSSVGLLPAIRTQDDRGQSEEPSSAEKAPR